MALENALDKSMTLGQRIAYLRKLRGFSQKDLASRIGLNNNYLSRLENDRFKPAPNSMARLCQELGVEPEELVEDASTRQTMTDPLLFRAFHNAQALDDQDKRVLVHIINAFLTRMKVEKAIQTTER